MKAKNIFRLIILILVFILLVGCEKEEENTGPDFESNEEIFVRRMVGFNTRDEVEFYKGKCYYLNNVYYYVGEFTVIDLEIDYKVLYIISNGRVECFFPIKDEEVASEDYPSYFYNYTIAMNEGISKEYTKSDLDKIAERVFKETND